MNKEIKNTVIKGCKIKLYPTPDQIKILDLWCSHTRGLWNSLLGLEIKTYRERKIFLWRNELQDLVVKLKKDPEMQWLGDLPAHSILFVINNLCSALKGAAKNASNRKGFPKFKKKRWGIGTVYMLNKDTHFFENCHKVKLPKTELIKYRGNTLLQGRLVCSKITKDGNGWFLSCSFEVLKPQPIPSKVKRIALDLGVNRFATIYDGETFVRKDAPKFLRKAERTLKRRQRSLSRRKKGSSRRQSQVEYVHSTHRKVANKRINFLHKLSHELITKAQEIVVEDLNILGMLRNHHLAKSIADASMGEFLRQLKYKCDWYGRDFIEVDRWFASSQICSSCGRKHPEMKDLSRRTIKCECGLVMDRDENAAKNIYKYGEELRNCLTKKVSATDVEIGDHLKVAEPSEVPIIETSIIKPLEELCALMKV
jgi:putative transposase